MICTLLTGVSSKEGTYQNAITLSFLGFSDIIIV